MLIKVDENLWFDNEKLYIIDGEKNKVQYEDNIDKFSVVSKKVSNDWYPTLIFLASTRCNLRCKYCFAHDGTYDVEGKKHLITFDEFKRIFDYFYSVYGHINAISFFGGEPMLNYTEIDKFCQYLFENYTEDERPILGINTNGTIMNENIKKTISRYGINFGTSLDGLKDINDEQRVGPGIESVFDKVRETLEYIQDVPVAKIVQFTVTKNQIIDYKKGDYFKWMLEMEKMGVDFTEVVPVTTEDMNLKITLEDEEIRKNYDLFCKDLFDYTISKIKVENGNMQNCSKLVVGVLCRIMGRKYQNDCSAGYSYSITPQEEIFPCHSFVLDKRYGVKFHEDFDIEDLNKNEYFQQAKKASRESIGECRSCIGTKLCPYYCRGLSLSTYGKVDLVFEERCHMMNIIVRESIRFLSGPEFKNNRSTIITNLVEYNNTAKLSKC